MWRRLVPTPSRAAGRARSSASCPSKRAPSCSRPASHRRSATPWPISRAASIASTARRTTLVEINPLFVQKNGSVLAGDAKLDVDDNALFRQTELAKLKEVSPNEEAEEKARALGFSFVQLDGEVGIIGNGAGLVMATLDAVRNAGGHAANFLDVGGGAKEAVVKAALEIVLSNPRDHSVMINIFGGITRDDDVISEEHTSELQS